MIAWHYTSGANWDKIRKEGLVPRLIDHPDVLALPVGPVFGTWTWPNPQEGQAHLGNVLFQFASKGDQRVVKLAVDHEEADEWTNLVGDTLHLRHHGFQLTYTRGRVKGPEHLGPKYHVGEESLILGQLIQPKRLHLVGDYDLVAMLSTSSVKHDYKPITQAIARSKATPRTVRLPRGRVFHPPRDRQPPAGLSGGG